MNKRYFKIIPADAADAAQLKVVMRSKTFYPEATSDPALPVTYDNTFDYRQLFIVEEYCLDGSVVVYTRSEYELADFGTNVIPDNDWTDRYRLQTIPTIVDLPTYYDDVIAKNGNITRTNIVAFKSYDYNLFNN